MKTVIICFCLIFLLSCKSSEEENLFVSKEKSNIKLVKYDSLQIKYSDNFIIGRIGPNSYIWKNLFFLTDVRNKQVIVFDTSFNFIKKIGREGKGPGEFVYSPFFIHNKEELQIYSPKLKKVNIYNKHLEYVTTFNLDGNFIYHFKPGLKVNDKYVFSALYPSSVMKVDYYENYKSLILLDSEFRFENEFLSWSEIYFNEKILGFLGTNNKVLLTLGSEGHFFAMQNGNYKIFEFDSNFNEVRSFGNTPLHYKKLPLNISPEKTQRSFESFVEYKTNVTELKQIMYDLFNKYLVLEYTNVSKDEIYKKNSFLSPRYLQIYNNSANVIFDSKVNGQLLFIWKGKYYFLTEETPNYFNITILKIDAEN